MVTKTRPICKILPNPVTLKIIRKVVGFYRHMFKIEIVKFSQLFLIFEIFKCFLNHYHVIEVTTWSPLFSNSTV